jgi:hypothetical protein
VLQLPDINANRSVSGSGDLVSFEAKMMCGADGSAADGAAEKTMAAANICQKRRIVFWPGMDVSSICQI